MSLLDLGCGPGLLLDYLEATGGRRGIAYQGIDLSPRMIAAARSRWPNENFSVRDIMTDPLPEQSVDYVIANGVLTARCSVERSKMVRLAQQLITAAFQSARMGIAFNVMSAHVDWERDDLFHWQFDEVAAFLKKAVSRHFVFRFDYGLYEFTTYVWRNPQRPIPVSREMWWQR